MIQFLAETEIALKMLKISVVFWGTRRRDCLLSKFIDSGLPKIWVPEIFNLFAHSAPEKTLRPKPIQSWNLSSGFGVIKVHVFWDGHKFCKISTLILSYVVPVQSKVEISQNFVAFSEFMICIFGYLILSLRGKWSG